MKTKCYKVSSVIDLNPSIGPIHHSSEGECLSIIPKKSNGRIDVWFYCVKAESIKERGYWVPVPMLERNLYIHPKGKVFQSTIGRFDIDMNQKNGR